MPIVVKHRGSANPYIEELQEQLAQQQSSAVDWLVIAHNDPSLIHRLAEACAENSAAVLQVPQSLWDLEAQTLPAAIEWALCEANVRHILLVGHSDCSFPAEAARAFDRMRRAGSEKASADAAYKRLLKGAQLVHARTQQAKEHFAAQVGSLYDHPEIWRRLTDGVLQIHALFYMAGAGVFLAYDLPSERFWPLLDS